MKVYNSCGSKIKYSSSFSIELGDETRHKTKIDYEFDYRLMELKLKHKCKKNWRLEFCDNYGTNYKSDKKYSMNIYFEDPNDYIYFRLSL